MADNLRALVFQAETAAGWGWLSLAASSRGLRFLGLPSPSEEAATRKLRQHYPEAELQPDDPFLQDIAGQIQTYLAGERREFVADLDLRGHTTFELSVWAVTARILYGETRTYGWVGGQVGGGPGVAQAVGAALGNNPVPLIIPCHRVIGSDGSLHGFAGGLDLKARLLALENRQMMFTLAELE
jgi:methylated-DNA-[protein]-cysteine S-methyltransferase